MTSRKVIATGKDTDGDILSLCNRPELWSPRIKASAINDIENGTYRYFVRDSLGVEADGKVGYRTSGKYLYTVPDNSSENNLDNLPNC